MCVLACSQVATGSQHSLFLSDAGSLYFSGTMRGFVTESGQEDTLNPVSVEAREGCQFVGIGAGAGHCAAVAADGGLYVWGASDYGQLGLGSAAEIKALGSEEMVQISRHAGEENLAVTEPVLVEALWEQGIKVKAVACCTFTTIALTATGEVYSCGNTTNGQCGRSAAKADDKRVAYMDRRIRETALVTLRKLRPVKGLSNIRRISCGDSHCIAASFDGRCYTWGLGTNGRLGQEDGKTRYVPESPATISSHFVTSVACAGESTYMLAGSYSLSLFKRRYKVKDPARRDTDEAPELPEVSEAAAEEADADGRESSQELKPPTGSGAATAAGKTAAANGDQDHIHEPDDTSVLLRLPIFPVGNARHWIPAFSASKADKAEKTKVKPIAGGKIAVLSEEDIVHAGSDCFSDIVAQTHSRRRIRNSIVLFNEPLPPGFWLVMEQFDCEIQIRPASDAHIFKSLTTGVARIVAPGNESEDWNLEEMKDRVCVFGVDDLKAFEVSAITDEAIEAGVSAVLFFPRNATDDHALDLDSETAMNTNVGVISKRDGDRLESSYLAQTAPSREGLRTYILEVPKESPDTVTALRGVVNLKPKAVLLTRRWHSFHAGYLPLPSEKPFSNNSCPIGMISHEDAQELCSTLAGLKTKDILGAVAAHRTGSVLACGPVTQKRSPHLPLDAPVRSPSAPPITAIRPPSGAAAAAVNSELK
eukprot:GHVU01231768.1.p1 GENE.GHVU01231768.1~~GHVU01231768.1.p1  ORF type:complete len:706 (-),score=78.88 GHVU01231768.1:1601-3718(-)